MIAKVQRDAAAADRLLVVGINWISFFLLVALDRFEEVVVANGYK